MSSITRTFFSTVAAVKLFDNSSDEIITRDITIPGKLAAVDVKKHIDKNPDFVWYTLLKVLSVNYDEKLYSMTEQRFMEMGKPYDARNKETRGMVSKEIIGCMARAVCVDNETCEIRNLDIMLPRRMDCDSAKKYLNKQGYDYTVVKLFTLDVKQLYAMPVDVFMENAEILPPRAVKDSDK